MNVQQPQRLQGAIVAHMALLQKFIELTQAELDRAECAFTRESLGDLLETLRGDMKCHGGILNSLPLHYQAEVA